MLVLMARTGDAGSGASGISAFAVPADLPGISYGKKEEKMGWNSQPTRVISFDNVRIPAQNLLGREGEGFKIRSEEHTSELQSPCNLVCRLLLEKKKNATLEEARFVRLNYRYHPPVSHSAAHLSRSNPALCTRIQTYNSDEHISHIQSPSNIRC